MYVIPLHSASANYQEWEVTLGKETYTVCQDNGVWTLLLQRGAEWPEIGTAQTVLTFLTQYAMILETP